MLWKPASVYTVYATFLRQEIREYRIFFCSIEQKESYVSLALSYSIA